MAAVDDGKTPSIVNGKGPGSFAVLAAHPLPGAGGGLRAFAVRDEVGERPDLMAVQTRPDAPPRAPAISTLAGARIAGVLTPVAVTRAGLADGQQGLFVVGAAPPGPPLAETLGHSWPDHALIEGILRPAALALSALEGWRVPHRAIRLNNVFRRADGRAVLGSFWAAPPASLQPALFEPPYVAMCPPAGRGEGSIGDDVYALGVLLLVLALGQAPLAGLDDEAIVRRKLERGCFEALAGEQRLSSGIGDLLRGMLAEDPEHRPSPAMLCDPAAARARRLAARPPRRAQRPLDAGGSQVSDPRSLAFLLAKDPERHRQLLRSPAIEHWARRSLGDTALANRIEAAARGQADSPGSSRADAFRCLRVIAALDPIAPLCWRGLSFWPDGLGPLLAAEDPGRPDSRLEEVIEGEILASWAEERPERCDRAGLKIDARRYRALLRRPGWSGGLPRLRYELNAELACLSPLLADEAVSRAGELLPALEARAPASPTGQRPVDREIVAFLATRADVAFERPPGERGRASEPGAALAPLRMLAQLQQRFHPEQSFPRLSAWIGWESEILAGGWHSQARRARITEALASVIASGKLADMLAILDNPRDRALDEAEAARARATIAAIDAELTRLHETAGARAALAGRIGAEVTTAAGALALAGSVLAMALG